MTILGRPAHEYLFTIVLWVIVLLYTGIALGFPPAGRALPLLIGVALVVLVTVDLVSMTDTRLGRRLHRLNPGGVPGAGGVPDKGLRRRETIAWLIVLTLLVLMLLVGTLPAVAFYVAATSFFLGRRSLWTAVAFGVVVAGVCYLLFDLTLRVPLYLGLFFS